jgi:hypothetical protein
MSDLDLVREEVLAALEMAYPQKLQPGEITSRMVMDRLHLDKTTVYRMLAREVEEGKLIEVAGGRVDDKGRICKAWTKPPEV